MLQSLALSAFTRVWQQNFGVRLSTQGVIVEIDPWMTIGQKHCHDYGGVPLKQDSAFSLNERDGDYDWLDSLRSRRIRGSLTMWKSRLMWRENKDAPASIPPPLLDVEPHASRMLWYHVIVGQLGMNFACSVVLDGNETGLGSGPCASTCRINKESFCTTVLKISFIWLTTMYSKYHNTQNKCQHITYFIPPTWSMYLFHHRPNDWHSKNTPTLAPCYFILLKI